MNLFSKPGPLRALMEARGFTSEQIASIHANEKVSSMEFFFVDTTPLDKDFFTTANKLKLVAMFGVGLDHINMDARYVHLHFLEMYSSSIRRAMQMCLKLLHIRCILALKRLFSSF